MERMKRRVVWGIAVLLAVSLPLLFWWFHTARERPLSPPPPVLKSAPPAKPSAPAAPPKAETPIETSSYTLSPGNLRNLTREGLLPRLVYLPEGDRDRVFASLRRQGLPLWVPDRYLLPEKVTPGWIRIESSLSLKEFFRRIEHLPREKTRRVVMYSGDSLDDFIRQFSRQTLLDPRVLFDEYFRYSPYIDGGILAGFYRLPYRLSPGPAMAYLTEKSERVFRELAEKHLGAYDSGRFKRYLIIASIIQRETWREEEMPLIASVIENRLRKGMRLQIDATLNYGPWSHKIITPERIRRDTSRFNTYKFKGLPPEPLGSVTRPALEAALSPRKTDYLYFVRNLYGTHDFAVDYAAHLANISRIKAERAKLERSKRHWKKMNETGEPHGK